MPVPTNNHDSADYVQTPCIRICQLDDQQICTGCLRNAQEIQAWPDASTHQRRLILDAIDRRAQQRAD
jgi:predicted Fe-S protein YdhL (DUF1289 family)